MIRAIIRPEKVGQVSIKLKKAGFPAVIKADVSGRGRQLGVKVGDIYYDELAKVLLLMVIEDQEKEQVVKIISNNAKTGAGGGFGDGKIFISQVEEVHTIGSVKPIELSLAKKGYKERGDFNKRDFC